MKQRKLLLWLFFFPVVMQAAEPTMDELIELSLEELMSLELTVTSAAKKPQRLAEAASAISVLTHEDIRSAGVNSLADLLRLVPGVQVARINAHKWAVSVRGFSSQFSSKLQVLIDGRSIYSHLAASVIWNLHHPILDDIERIEVIRGTGASLWGANAMNGVINIITKHSQDSQGNMLIAAAGNEDKLSASFRHGGEIAAGSYYNLYATTYERDNGASMNGEDTNDLSRGFQGGFRTDIALSEQDKLNFQGGYFEGEEEENMTSELLPKQSIDTKAIQYNLLGRWQHSGRQGDELAVQFYFNREQWDNDISSQAFPDFYIDTYDIDFQHRFQPFQRHDLTWGLGYRLVVDSYERGILVNYTDRHRKIPLYSGFIQDEISIIDDSWRLIIGSKFEHNDFTGFEFQPTVRSIFNWQDHTFWAAYSRSTRTPSRGEDGGVVSSKHPLFGFPIEFVGVQGKLKSEVLHSFEIGYRYKFNERLNVDLAAYYNDYDRLLDINSQTLPSPIVIVDAAYKGNATVMGFEAAMDWRPSDEWALKLSYSYLDDKSSVADIGNNLEASPHHQANLFTQYHLSSQWDLGLTTRYVDRIDVYNIDAYVAIDSRIAFKPVHGLEISVVGQNLFDSHHPEFGESAPETTPTEVERSIYGKLSWQF